MARPLGQIVSVFQRNLANRHAAHASIEIIQGAILVARSGVCGYEIGWILKVKVISVGDLLGFVIDEFHDTFTVFCSYFIQGCHDTSKHQYSGLGPILRRDKLLYVCAGFLISSCSAGVKSSMATMRGPLGFVLALSASNLPFAGWIMVYSPLACPV